jgi:uncharacterized protein
MIDDKIRNHVAAWLKQVEREEGVRILFAAESGSRAWGFASPDSDYDVRFIYAHPRNWYASLHEARDVIERPLDEKLVDLAGWDVRKALRLLLKSNPVLYEWFCSPIVYLDDGLFNKAAGALFARHASPRALAHHYYSIARSQWRHEIENRDTVKLKKYFYVIRPLFALQWVANHGTVPPMNIMDLMQDTSMPDDVRQAVVDLVEKKRETPELGLRPRIDVLNSWIVERLETLNPDLMTFPGHAANDTIQDADQLFRDTIGM